MNAWSISIEHLCGGYGAADESVRGVSRGMYEISGLKLDCTYTGKAFAGMLKYLSEHHITGKNILFIHTGGTVLFQS